MVTRQGRTGGRSRRQKAEGRRQKQKAESGRQKAEGRRQKAEGRRQKEGTTSMNFVVPFSFSLLPTAYCLLPTNPWLHAVPFWHRSSALSVSLYACQNAWPPPYLASRCRSGGHELHLPCQRRDIRRYNRDAPISHATRAAAPKGRPRLNLCLPSGHSRFCPEGCRQLRRKAMPPPEPVPRRSCLGPHSLALWAQIYPMPQPDSVCSLFVPVILKEDYPLWKVWRKKLLNLLAAKTRLSRFYQRMIS